MCTHVYICIRSPPRFLDEADDTFKKLCEMAGPKSKQTMPGLDQNVEEIQDFTHPWGWGWVALRIHLWFNQIFSLFSMISLKIDRFLDFSRFLKFFTLSIFVKFCLHSNFRFEIDLYPILKSKSMKFLFHTELTNHYLCFKWEMNEVYVSIECYLKPRFKNSVV